MSTKVQLGEIFDNLGEVKAKFVFLTNANLALHEDVVKGNTDLSEDDTRGLLLINLQIEKQLKTALEDIEKLL